MSGTATLGIDYGGTKALGVRLASGGVTAEASAEAAGPPGEALVALLERLWDPEVAAVGAGVAGLVNASSGRFVWGPHVPWEPVALRDLLEQRFGVPAAVDNDANAAAVGELRMGALQGVGEALLVTVGTGIGGAIVSGGEVQRGAGGLAGEWGHRRYADPGLPCSCGAEGCWETVVSGPALARAAAGHIAAQPSGTLASRLAGDPPLPEAVTAAAASGDPEAGGLVARLGRDLGWGLADLITVFDPEVVVVGGGLGSVGESLLAPARSAAAEGVLAADHRAAPRIVGALLGARAGAVGAALLAGDVLRSLSPRIP